MEPWIKLCRKLNKLNHIVLTFYLLEAKLIVVSSSVKSASSVSLANVKKENINQFENNFYLELVTSKMT